VKSKDHLMEKPRVKRPRGSEDVLSTLLPIFPLDLVLLPGAALPLHIFEPRYREMIASCEQQNAPFGVVRSLGEEVAQIGCTAQIVSIPKKYDDGRMDVLTRGGRRFEVIIVNQDLPYLQAEVFFFEDEGPPANREETARVVALHREILGLAGATPEDLAGAENTKLSFHLAGSLPLDLDFKQTLLIMKSEAERVEKLCTYLESILPTLRRTLYVREKASGNGHGAA
jgi:Lon protease-like protein